jgi:hypothetical protein
MGMTDTDESEFLDDLKNRFYHEFSEMCDRYLAEAKTRNLESEATDLLSEAAKVTRLYVKPLAFPTPNATLPLPPTQG